MQGLNLQPSETKESYSQTLGLENRREIIRRQIIAFYLGMRREQPEPVSLEIEVDLAFQDWEEIPTAVIPMVAREARKQAGEFMPSNGLMAKIWRESQSDKHESAAKAIRDENTRKYLSAPVIQRTPEEIKEIEDMCRGIRESLK